MRSLRLLTAGLLAGTLLSACDSGPSGPGAVDARVEPGETGAAAAVVEVTGDGVRGFEAAGDTRIFASEVTGTPGLFRLVLVNPGPGEMRFRIEVEDRGARLPSGTVLFAADTANAPVHAVDELDVRVER